MKKLDGDKKDTIPGGTLDYETPEYFSQSREPMDYETLQSQDFFAIGATIFYLKYGEEMLDCSPYSEKTEEEKMKISPIYRKKKRTNEKKHKT